MEPIRIYLAGPDVFFPCDLESGQKKIEFCKELEAEGIYPSFLLPPDLFSDKFSKIEQRKIINQQCKHGIINSELVVANLTPFRGFEMDSGTAFEIGFANALNKKIYAYSNISETYLERMIHENGTYQDSFGAWRDKDHNVIENFDLTENCMISASCEKILQPSVLEKDNVLSDSLYMFKKTILYAINDFEKSLEEEKESIMLFNNNPKSKQKISI